jgi:hypothetical protein
VLEACDELNLCSIIATDGFEGIKNGTVHVSGDSDDVVDDDDEEGGGGEGEVVVFDIEMHCSMNCFTSMNSQSIA